MVVQLPHQNNFAFLQRQASFERCFYSASLTVSEIRTQLSGEHLQALNAILCDEVLLELKKSFNTFFLDIGGG